jgi:hypothetical protein
VLGGLEEGRGRLLGLDLRAGREGDEGVAGAQSVSGGGVGEGGGERGW